MENRFGRLKMMKSRDIKNKRERVRKHGSRQATQKKSWRKKKQWCCKITGNYRRFDPWSMDSIYYIYYRCRWWSRCVCDILKLCAKISTNSGFINLFSIFYLSVFLISYKHSNITKATRIVNSKQTTCFTLVLASNIHKQTCISTPLRRFSTKVGNFLAKNRENWDFFKIHNISGKTTILALKSGF